MSFDRPRATGPNEEPTAAEWRGAIDVIAQLQSLLEDQTMRIARRDREAERYRITLFIIATGIVVLVFGRVRESTFGPSPIWTLLETTFYLILCVALVRYLFGWSRRERQLLAEEMALASWRNSGPPPGDGLDAIDHQSHQQRRHQDVEHDDAPDVEPRGHTGESGGRQ